jgi:hypothetical protein
MLIQETYIDADRGLRFGESDEYEPFTDNPGELFRALQKEYGRCVSRVYVDPPDGGQPIAVGWVFQGRQKYEDTPTKTYIREVWVTCLERKTEIKRIPHYFDLRRRPDHRRLTLEQER